MSAARKSQAWRRPIRFEPLRCRSTARRRRRPASLLRNVQVLTAWRRIKLMELWTQEMSRETNGGAKLGSICTDESMKSSRLHRRERSGCADEQVNCPFCLFVRKTPETNFPLDANVGRGEKKKSSQVLAPPLEELPSHPPPSGDSGGGAAFSALAGGEREIFHQRQPRPGPRNHHARAVPSPPARP